MNVRTRRILIWSGLFLLAYIGGSMLGRFVVAGVDFAPSNAAITMALPHQTNDANAAQTMITPPEQDSLEDDIGPANHVCTGCDAGQTRLRQMGEVPMNDMAGDDGEDADDEGE